MNITHIPRVIVENSKTTCILLDNPNVKILEEGDYLYSKYYQIKRFVFSLPCGLHHSQKQVDFLRNIYLRGDEIGLLGMSFKIFGNRKFFPVKEIYRLRGEIMSTILPLMKIEYLFPLSFNCFTHFEIELYYQIDDSIPLKNPILLLEGLNVTADNFKRLSGSHAVTYGMFELADGTFLVNGILEGKGAKVWEFMDGFESINANARS